MSFVNKKRALATDPSDEDDEDDSTEGIITLGVHDLGQKDAHLLYFSRG